MGNIIFGTEIKIAYIIACWSGSRRANFKPYEDNKIWCIERHIEMLKRRKHDLSQIMLMVSHNPEEPEYYRRFLNELPTKIQSARVGVWDRPNEGISYGSFANAYEICRDSFDYYIFVEDDYCFPLDNFDRKLVELYESKKPAGYMSGLFRNNHSSLPHGIAHSSVLEGVYKHCGGLPYTSPQTELLGDKGYGDYNQLAFSMGFSFAGFPLYDVLSDYCAAYLDPAGEPITTFGNPIKPLIMCPVQLADYILEKGYGKT
jgi:hypothetical protein